MAYLDTVERPRSHPRALENLIGRAFSDIRLTSQERLVLINLCHHAKNRAGEAFPAQATIATETGVCVSLVGRSIRRLTELGYIEKRDRFRKDGGRSSCLIVIFGMQYFPDDWTSGSPKPSGSAEVATNPSIRARDLEVSVPDTVGIGIGYGTYKEEDLKEDSLPESKVTQNPADLVEESEIEFINKNVSEWSRLSKHVWSNRQCLDEHDLRKISELESNPVFQRACALGQDLATREQIERGLASFVRKRAGGMTAPDISKLAKELCENIPASLVALMFKRIDGVYKPHYKIAPKAENFTACIKNEASALRISLSVRSMLQLVRRFQR